jgi:acyl dehydratase
VNIGDEITPLAKIATTQTLIKWAGASGDFNPLHYDPAFTASTGNPETLRPIVHGALKRQWLLHLVTNWIGDDGDLTRFSCRYRAVDYPRAMKTTGEPVEGETWWCKGKVTKKYVLDEQHCVDCEIWVENGKGEITTSGKATVVLPAANG